MAEDVVTGLIKGNESLNRQFINNLTTIDVRRVANEKIYFNYQTMVLHEQPIYGDDALIWGHEVQCIWGSYDWTDPTARFVLGHDTYGLLGTGELGGVFGDNITRVVNLNNTFKERFTHEDFISSVSTANVVTSTGKCYFDSGEVLVSDIVALNEVAYTSAKVSVSGLATSNLAASVSFNGGSSYSAVNFEELKVVTNSSLDGLKVRFLGSSDCDGSNTYLDDYTIVYN